MDFKKKLEEEKFLNILNLIFGKINQIFNQKRYIRHQKKRLDISPQAIPMKP